MLNIHETLYSAGVECWIPQPSKSRDPKEPWKFSLSGSREALLKDAHEATMRCFSKIDECDIVYLIDNEGYVGKSGLLDLGYAYSKGKELYALQPIDDPAVTGLLNGVVSPQELVSIARRN
jgi:nucleoside 2-deoxyribosyltransferase